MDNTHLSGIEAHHQVVRYSALIGGIFYGLLHQGTLQRKHDEDKVCPHSSPKSDADLVSFLICPIVNLNHCLLLYPNMFELNRSRLPFLAITNMPNEHPNITQHRPHTRSLTDNT